MVYVFLSHDVDWGKTGPPVSHVLARKERFDKDVLRRSHLTNLYYNFGDYMEIEERFNVRSTFFFRTYIEAVDVFPPPYHIEEYRPEIRSLLRGGWEVGLHLDQSSHSSSELIRREKEGLENAAGVQISGNRVHYTMNNSLLHRNLQELSFKYDSSAKFSRKEIIDKDFGYFETGKLVVFPITIMDAFLFSYLALAENQVVSLIKQAVNKCRKLPTKKRIMTVIWHDCALKMKKGRMYPEVLKYLTSLNDVEVKRGIDLCEMVERGVMR